MFQIISLDNKGLFGRFPLRESVTSSRRRCGGIGQRGVQRWVQSFKIKALNRRFGKCGHGMNRAFQHRTFSMKHTAIARNLMKLLDLGHPLLKKTEYLPTDHGNERPSKRCTNKGHLLTSSLLQIEACKHGLHPLRRVLKWARNFSSTGPVVLGNPEYWLNREFL